MKLNLLNLMLIFSIFITACGGSAGNPSVSPSDYSTGPSGANNWGGVPVVNNIIEGTPPQVIQAIEQGRLNGQYPAYHGTNAYALLSSRFLKAAGYPESIYLPLQGQFMSWDGLEANGACFVCLTRNQLVSNAPGFTPQQVIFADHLWIGLEGMDQQVTGTGYLTASSYSVRVVSTRLFDMQMSIKAQQIAEQTIASLQPLVDAGTASVNQVDELNLAKARVNFEINRQAYVTAIMASDDAALFEVAMNTPIVVEFKPVSASEVTRTNFVIKNGQGVGTRFKATNVPYSQIARVYVPADKVSSIGQVLEQATGAEIVAVMDTAQAEVAVSNISRLTTTRVPGGFMQGYNLWSSIPQGMYNLAFKGAAFFEVAIGYYVPMASLYVFLYTPAAIYVYDRWEMAGKYTTLQMQGRTNLSPAEYYEIESNYLMYLDSFGYDPSWGMMDGIYSPLLDLVGIDPSNTFSPWSSSPQVEVGGTVELPIIAKTGTTVQCDIEKHGLPIGIDCIIDADYRLAPITIKLDGFSSEGYPIVTASTTNEQGQLLTGTAIINTASSGEESANSIIKAGCQELPEFNNLILNRVFVIRWVTDESESKVRFYSRPYFWVDNTCNTQ